MTTDSKGCVSTQDKHLFADLIRYRATLSGAKEAVYDYGNDIRYTYADLVERSDRLAAFLQYELEVEKGDRIAFCSPNSIAFIDGFYASYKTGAIITTYNFLLHPKELDEMLKLETPKVLFYATKYADTIAVLRQDNPGIRVIPLDGQLQQGDFCTYDDIMAYKAPPHTDVPSEIDMEDIQMLLHTGGTTGTPKAAMISYRSLFYNALSEILTFGLTEQDTVYVFLPFFHTAAWNVLTLPLLLAGGRIILTEGFDADAALNIIEKERPTVAMAVETIYKAMAAHPRFGDANFTSYRWMLSGAAPIAKPTMALYWDKGVKLVNAYGMTEIGPSNLAPSVNDISLEEIRNKWNAVGKPMYFNKVRIVDEYGGDVAQGEKGELIWQGNLTFSGYWKNEKGSQEACKDGWVYSGDIGYQDEDGVYYVCDRKKNMFISGGENVFPLEIQNVLQTHPDVEGSCVIGVPDDRWGEVGRALVVCTAESKIDETELRGYLSKKISRIKIPKYIQFIEEIPRNAVGKLDMAKILKCYGGLKDERNQAH